MAMLRRGSMGAVLTTILVALAGSLWAPPAEAAAVDPVAITCGAVLQQNAYLAADLTCPSGNGVTAAASLSIDLRGHHLTGSSSGVGITVQYPATVKVTHGRLTGWGTGLTTVSTTPDPTAVRANVTVIAVTFLHNGIGLAPGEVNGNGSDVIYYTVYRSWFVSNKIGVGGFIGNSETTVSGATFRNNQVAVSFHGNGFTILTSVTVSNSEFSNNASGVYCTKAYCGLEGNSFSANPTAVTTEDFFSALQMTGNTVSGSTTAVAVKDSFQTNVIDNIFTGNKTALQVNGGDGGLRGNVLSGNVTALSITNAGLGFGDEPPVDISGNRVTNNTGDGIVISNSKVALKNNISTFNHGWGINAPGAIDAGGNRAFGNYHSPQCVGVVCTH